MVPGAQLEVWSMEDAWEKYYRAEERTGTMLLVFSILALALSCAGLFGMTSFVLGRRVKEIGIRKVLGATTSSLMVSLTREYVLLVLLANCIGWPVAYYAARSWLQDFAYQTPLSPWIFVLSACFTLAIALITISARIVQTSRMNPVMSLSYE
jgi:putative ABC transport system permease protein